MRRTSTLVLVIILACAAVFFTSFSSGNKSTPLIEATMPMYEMAKTHTLEVLDAMPEEKFSFKPSEESMTFGQQMVHIAYTLHFFNERMIQGKDMKFDQPDASTMSKAEIRSMTEMYFDEMIAAISEISDEQMAETRPFGPGKSISVYQVVLFAHDHTTNHRAKANLYIRMNGMKPPAYKFI